MEPPPPYGSWRAVAWRLVAVLLLCYWRPLPGAAAVFHSEEPAAEPKDLAIPPGADYDREELQKLTEFRQRHRKTVDGRLCAAAFVRNGNKFTDCTATEAPDGSVGREWCYVEVQLVGAGFRDWDFCAGVVDYDVLRSKATLLSQMKASELAHSVLQLTKEESRLEKTLRHFEAVCGHGAESHESEMHELSHALRGLERALQQVEANARTLHTLREQWEALEEQLAIARKNALRDKRNCAVVQGYSAPAVGDGIRASYFDNPYLRGPPVGFFNHPSLSLTFDEILPVSGVDIRSFSVRFEGYLRAPVSDTYTFWMEGDCNFRVFVDGELVVTHGLETRGNFASAFSPIGVIALDGRPTSSAQLASRPLTLEGGKRYPLVVEYSHQSALKYLDENVARLSLSWGTATRPRAMIAPEHFFRSRDSGESLVISALEARLFDLAMLENGAQAFLHVTNLVVSDVPDRFRGARMVRTVVRPEHDHVSFHISHDAVVYVALSSQSSFIPKAAEDGSVFQRSSEVISVYAFDSNSEEAHSQQEFAVYYRRFKAGVVKFEMLRETSFFFFLQPTLANFVCQDDVLFLPFKNGDSCAASSSLAPAFDCSQGFGGGYWKAASGLLANQWLTRTFVSPVELLHFHFSPLAGGVPMRARLVFPDGVVEEFELQSQLRYEVGCHGVIDSLRIEFDASASEGTLGGSFALYGRECGSQTVVDDAVRFPVRVDFCQAGESCGSHYVDVGHVKGIHGRLSYGWGSSNVIASMGELPFCAAHGRHSGSAPSHAPPTEPTTAQDHADATPMAGRRTSFGRLLRRRAGLPMGVDQWWAIDVPEHGVYRVEILLSALCGTVESASLQLNGVEVLEGEWLQSGQSIEVSYFSCSSFRPVPRSRISGAQRRGFAMEDKLKTLVFHHYVPKDESLKRLVRSNLEDYKQIEEDIDAAIARIIEDYTSKVGLVAISSSIPAFRYRVALRGNKYRLWANVCRCRPSCNRFQDVLSLVLPSKQNWDLKRNLRDARQTLATRTDMTIMKLLQANRNKEEIDSVMLAQFTQNDVEREFEQDDY
ncbi:PA14 domain-containing protein [Babesia caballi]|uniref:PA14 domain-containing protein n=1 Tax=Babesia caballi TaxID=5871 RepID=A0AAV4LV84_BABCB|nr:PA14 domain-containing protein [Babesia caballi]